jgi:hypothetical protein
VGVVSGLAWNPNGLSFFHAFRSSASRLRATPDILLFVIYSVFDPLSFIDERAGNDTIYVK